MGQSTDAYLFYGICFDEGALHDEDDEYTEPQERLKRKLLEWSGFNEPEPEFPESARGRGRTPEWEAWKVLHDAWEARKVAATLGVEVDAHCSCDYPMYFLTVKDIFFQAWRGDPKEIPLQELAQRDTSELDARLKQACELMNWPYEQPKWYIASMWC